MDEVPNSKPRVRCPGCGRVFEFDLESRGCATRCPRCEVEFLIPDTGMDGVPFGDAEDVMDVICPHCATAFLLPSKHAGEIADCAACHKVFTIPGKGGKGLPVRAPSPSRPPAPSTAPPTEPFPRPMAAPPPPAAPAQPRATVFLSRREVLERHASGVLQPDDRLGEAEDGGKAGHAANDQSARGVIELRTDPVFEPAGARTVRRSDLPEWLPTLDFARRERIIEYEEGAEPPMRSVKIVALLPVLLIPLAAFLATVVHPVMAGAFTFVAGLVLWGIQVAKLLPAIGRKVLVLTNFRVIMADLHEVVDIDLL